MILLKPNPINHHLVFFFISKTFIEPLLTDMQREHPQAWTWGNSQATGTVPTEVSQQRWSGAHLRSRDAGCLTGRSLQPPWAGLCVLGRTARGSGRIRLGPSAHLHVNSQTKAPPTGPSALRPRSGPSLSPWSLEAAGSPAGIWQTRLEGFVTLFRSPEPR